MNDMNDLVVEASEEGFKDMVEHIRDNYPEDLVKFQEADPDLLRRVFSSGFGFGQRFQQDTILDRLKGEGVDLRVVNVPIQ